jgi:lipopolysaccharide transport system ATP-binding protein
MAAIFNRRSGIKNRQAELIWALKDVSFEVQQGEVVGIVGRNGAGKSTLLKILSRITEPTEGRVELRGRVGSLLEVGTGFHPELTGHENIYLYGAILGMDRREVTRKFDEIVAFAELEKFIDTPVKKYSSGMYMRLAFAVAAHLEPEILLVDEVLAVGDLSFQKKCLGKMNDVSRQGRTVLFVTHNMGAVRSLCTRAILLRGGTIQKTGAPLEIAAEYENEEISQSNGLWLNQNMEEKHETACIESMEVINGVGQWKASFLSSERLFVRIKLLVNIPSPDLKVGFDLLKNGNVVFRSQQVDSPEPVPLITEGTHDLYCEIPCYLLNAGTYHVIPLISIHLIRYLRKDYVSPVLNFKIILDTTRSPFHTVLNEQNHPGTVFPLFHWKIK